MENLHSVGVLFFPTRHLFFPQERFFGVLGFLRRLTHGKDYSYYFIFIIIIQLLAETPTTSRLDSEDNKKHIVTPMKLIGYHKRLCLHKTKCTKSVPTNFLGAPKEYLLVWGTRPPRRRAVVTNTPHDAGMIMSAPTLCMIMSSWHPASSRQPDTPHHPSRPAPEFRHPILVRFPIMYIVASYSWSSRDQRLVLRYRRPYILVIHAILSLLSPFTRIPSHY